LRRIKLGGYWLGSPLPHANEPVCELLQVRVRPNNDTLYITAAIDVTEEPIILEIPAFDTIYASLMVTGYDHYVNIPLSTGKGDFTEPTKVLFYSERTPGYDGESVDGVDKIFEGTGDYLSAVFRVMTFAAVEVCAAAPASDVADAAKDKGIDAMVVGFMRSRFC
jgi:hypothetical protein